GGRAQGGGEQVPRHQPREEVEGEIGDPGAEELAEDQPVDHQQEQRPGQGPQEAQGGVLVLHLQFLAYEVDEKLAEGPDVPNRGPEASEEGLWGVDADERLVDCTGQGCAPDGRAPKRRIPVRPWTSWSAAPRCLSPGVAPSSSWTGSSPRCVQPAIALSSSNSRSLGSARACSTPPSRGGWCPPTPTSSSPPTSPRTSCAIPARWCGSCTSTAAPTTPPTPPGPTSATIVTPSRPSGCSPTGTPAPSRRLSAASRSPTWSPTACAGTTASTPRPCTTRRPSPTGSTPARSATTSSVPRGSSTTSGRG